MMSPSEGGALQSTRDSSVAGLLESETGTDYPVRARSHLLTLLGEELIGDDRLAIFELVKNGYDADATEVAITMNLVTDEPIIAVKDSGVGMTLDDLTNKWLELATDSRRKRASQRSKR